MIRRQIASAVRALLLMGLALGLPIVLVGSAIMARVDSPPAASESDIQHARELAITATVDYIIEHPEVEAIQGTPLELRRRVLESIVAEALTDDVVGGLLSQLNEALSGYLKSTSEDHGRLVLALGPVKSRVVQGVLDYWSRALDRLPPCEDARRSTQPDKTHPVQSATSTTGAAFLALLRCRPPSELKGMLLAQVGQHIREIDGAPEHEIVILTGQRHGQQETLGAWIGRLKLASEVFGQGSLVALSLVVFLAMGVAVIARLEGLPQDRMLHQLGLGLLVGALLLLLAAFGMSRMAGDTDYYRWLLHRPAADLSREEIVGIRLAIYAFNRVLLDAAGAILAMAASLGVAATSAITAAKLASRERTERPASAEQHPVANALALQAKKN